MIHFRFYISFFILFGFSSCAAILLPKKQKVIVQTNSNDTKVYLDDKELGYGSRFNASIDLSNTQGQIIIYKNGDKPVYDYIIKNRRPTGFYPLALISLPTIIFFPINFVYPKCQAYSKELNFKSDSNLYKLPIRAENNKYLGFPSILYNLNNYKVDFRTINTQYSENLVQHLNQKEIEFENDKSPDKYEGNQYVFKPNLFDNSKNNNIYFESETIESDLYKIFKKTNHVDSINKVFNDLNNTIEIEAQIKKITLFNILTRWSRFTKVKINLNWYIKNTYNEIIDSLSTTEYSGNFINTWFFTNYFKPQVFQNQVFTMINDAVQNSYINFYKSETFMKNNKINNDFNIDEENLLLAKISDDKKVNNKSDAFKATVIIKALENNKVLSHGSGFSISEDGYIITNYHVISGKFVNKQRNIKVIASDGQEYDAKIIRYNKYRDVALLKIDKKFERSFILNNENKIEIMSDVFTIGAPKSIELGQTISSGIISSFRDVNKNKILQLGMSVNSGNSGGAVFDQNGNLHGVVVSKLIGENTEGVGFAIPSYLISEYLNLTIR